MNWLSHGVLLAVAGAAGTLLRAGCHAVTVRAVGAGFPWSTLFVNVSGSLAFGVIFAWSRSRGLLPAGLETVLLVGLLGGFTTFSTFAFQTVEMAEAGRPAAAIAYILATNLAALAAIWVGLRLGG